MKKPIVKMEVVESTSKNKNSKSRRRFIKMSGLAIAGSGVLLACDTDDVFDPGGETPVPEPEPEPEPDPDPEEPTAFDLGSGDVGILNYALALEQLEAAFYTAVREGDYYAGASDEEQQVIDDLYNHEVIHRDFLRAAILEAVGGDESQVLPELEFNLDSVDLSSRDSVLQTAMALEDTGVGAYNGAGDRLESATYLTIAGKIVSVEARHASAIRSLLNPDSADFAGDDIIDENGLDIEYDPAEVFEIAGPFIETEFTANELPEPNTGS
ncbi:ferritin-like domain-containing protein [Salegentibacter sp. JZCK2]|uniref:ferritin-like domain-containing protein n=1 Tax=Salegentibacter tibetensis TaxID=2873600 RepID=UPI001CCADF0B|nr:ferritin-like domain-containing protein [Salegentibacter tibetensis]MBZ9730301.1 ferritin-like domain-containing protein [Salegentibacter tibetensis]